MIAARTAASSLATPLANEAMRLARACSIQDKSLLNPAPDHQVELGDDLAGLDQGWYASFDRCNHDGLRFGEQVAPDCHEVCDFSGRRNPLKGLCVDPFSPSSAGRPLADDAERASEATRP